MFHGLSAFPLTPLRDESVDTAAFVSLVRRLVDAKVDSIGVLGSTGNYAYLDRQARADTIGLAVEHAGSIPVIAGIGALRTRDVLALADDAQRAGASALLLAPVSYQRLSADEVYGLYRDVTRDLSVPLCVYDNPGTTGFTFTDELHGRIAALPNVASIKIPGVPHEPGAAVDRVLRLRALVPPHVTIGISGDSSAALGLAAGCDLWYSVAGGLFPHTALALVQAARQGDMPEAARLSERLIPLWDMFRRHGSLRVTATAAILAGLVSESCLPRPLETLRDGAREDLAGVLRRLALD